VASETATREILVATSALEAAVFDCQGKPYTFTPREPKEPCPFGPGTKEKVDFLRGRVERGEELWSVEDYRAGVGN
jgi:hypothetical protein